ncbi:MAG: PBSX family phage terminase large subunit [Gemmatimonadaceae bacterium]|nr:PBSX family phage terminase large subunit [Gemmatimonadaceae bacterium]
MWSVLCVLMLMLTRAELAARILALPASERAAAFAHLQRMVPAHAMEATGPAIVRTLPVARTMPAWAEPLRGARRYKGAKGGRGSGKSHFFAEELVERAVENPDYRAVCVREIQRSLEFSAKALIEKKIRTLGVSSQFEVTSRLIRRRGGSGLIIFEGLQDHTADTLKSLEGFDLAWVEEAQSLSERSIDILLPTIRAPGSEVWFSWNPRHKTDPVDVMFAPEAMDARMACVHCTYLDNPFLTPELRDEAERLKVSDPDKYNHVWLGGYDTGGKGRVYSRFLERPFPDGNVDPSVRDLGGTIYIGQDFNVNPMASVFANKVADECHIFDAWALPTSNTTEVCEAVKRAYPNRDIVFCPDPAGNQRRSSTTLVGQTDFTIIRSFGFRLHAPPKHPAVVDRENNANQMYEYEGRRRVRIAPKAAVLIEALNGLKYKPGTNLRDKASHHDHLCDAADYLLWQEFNVLQNHRASVTTFTVSG